ncbi:hypothetical protein [uncultured Chryseobacterium sp.]|uniref:hypothetical protein n=1 Tax=uncultured Chryseobacterium sp. TaxID=259322 RepID=UPI0025F759D4|nr:hypothetical protein [uncultured Chryseobacterium sp.]
MINFVKTKKEFEIYQSNLLNIFDIHKSFEENGFQDSFRYFISFEFDYMFHESFFENIKSFVESLHDRDLILYVIQPSPESFYQDFGKYNILKVGIQDTDEDLTKVLMDPSVDEIAIHSDEIVWFSPSKNWAIYGSRDWEIALIGFTDLETKELFIKSFRKNIDMFTTINEQVEILDHMLKFDNDVKKQYSALALNYQDRI